jgi:hypothetical protein
MGEVEKFDRMEHRDQRAARDLRDAADVAGRDEIGRGLHDIRDLAVAQPRGDLRLQNIIGARRTAAQMPFRRRPLPSQGHVATPEDRIHRQHFASSKLDRTNLDDPAV